MRTQEQLLMESDEVVMYHVKVDTCSKVRAHLWQCCGFEGLHDQG